MASATGIGGIFFRTRDPKGIAQWYLQHLGISAGADGQPWIQAAGPTVFAPFKSDTDYFPADRQWMLNLRVDDLPALIDALRSSDIAVETRPEWDGVWGKFARIHDPEGNPIELWEPPSTAS